MDAYPAAGTSSIKPRRADELPPTVQMLPQEQQRKCPFCQEQISVHARKCWRCHEHFSLPQDDLDERAYQFARREVLQDCVDDIKKWITRLGFGSLAGLAVVALLSMMRFQDVLEDLVADRVEATTGPVVAATSEQLAEAEDAMDQVEDKLRLAQHRIAQFDWMTDKLSETETAVLRVEEARLGLEGRAEKLADQFGQLEDRFITAKRQLRDDRDRRVRQVVSNFARQALTVDQLQQALAASDATVCGELLEALAPLRQRTIRLLSPTELSSDRPPVLYSSEVRLEWDDAAHDVGDATYRVYLDAQPDFAGPHARMAVTRVANLLLPLDFPKGPVYWRIEALDRTGRVTATSDVGLFEQYADSVDRIRRTGVVRVGVAYSAQGEFAYFDEQQNRLTGFDIELSRWLAQRLLADSKDVRPTFVNYNWRELFDSVGRNEVDFIISTITITPEREEEYSLRFSHPYYKTAQACIVLKQSGVRSVAQLRGRRLAVQAGTSSETVGEALTDSADLYRTANSAAALEALLRGEVDAVITDYEFALGEVRSLGQAAAVLAIGEDDFPAHYRGVRSEEYGIGVARSEAKLLARLNNAIAAAERANVLEQLKLQFVNGVSEPGILAPLPEVATPLRDAGLTPTMWTR